jgi:hypothetical protein
MGQVAFFSGYIAGVIVGSICSVMLYKALLRNGKFAEPLDSRVRAITERVQVNG